MNMNMNLEQFEAIFKGVGCAILFIGILFVIGILRTTSDKKSKNNGSYHEGSTGSGWDEDDADSGFGGSGWGDSDGGDGGGE